MSAVGARGGILSKVVGIESAVPLETLSEAVDVVRVPKAGDKVCLGALEKADLVWKAERERRVNTQSRQWQGIYSALRKRNYEVTDR